MIRAEMEVIRQLDGVLLVEDEFLIAWDVQERLAELGFMRIHHARNLSTARKLIRSKDVHLGLLDVNVSGNLVFPIATELLQRKIPIVFCTAQLIGQLPPEWAQHPVLSKPFDKARFLDTLARMLH